MGHELDRPVYRYVTSRGLAESWEEPGFGVLGRGMELPPQVEWWPRCGYRVALPLCDLQGCMTGIQVRSIDPAAKRKVLFPKGTLVKGSVFANSAGVDLLRGRRVDSRVVFLAEGLTDFLAIACAASEYAVLAAPGISFVSPAIGEWVQGARVVIAMDNDEAGSTCTTTVAPQLYRAGAESVFRVAWPNGCQDACDFVQQVGIVGLEEFITEQLAETAVL